MKLAMIEEFTGLKPKLHSFLVDDNSEHKKARGIIRNVEVLLNNKCLRDSMSRIEVKTIYKNL